MDRLTTDNRENNLQTLLNYAYAKDKAVHLVFGNDEDNIPLDEYIAHEARERGCPRTTTEVMEGGCMECDCPIAILNAVSIQAAELRARLMMIEDILGDTYDLDHLREMIEAEKDGRVLMAPCKIDQCVFSMKSTPITALRVWCLNYDTSYVFAEDGEYHSLAFAFAEFGKTVFLSREEAEAALAKMKEEEK